jgi:hypothetical protein
MKEAFVSESFGEATTCVGEIDAEKPGIRLYSETFGASASFFPAERFQNLLSQSAIK